MATAKPREGFTLAFEQKTLAVQPGDPVTYTILVRAHSGFSGSVTLQAVVLPDNLTHAFTPHGEALTTGFLVPSTAVSSAALTLQTRSGEEKNYSITVAATGGGQTRTITGRLMTRQNTQEALPAETQNQETTETQAFREGFSELTIFFWTFPHVPDEVRLFLIVAVVGCLGGLLHSTRSWVWYAGHAQLERSWIPFYASTPFVGMAMAILFYLLFRAGFISPTTPAAETNTYGFAAIAGLVGLFSNRAARMLENVADILFTKADVGAGTVSPGEFHLTASGSPQTAIPGDAVTYGITVVATEDFSKSVVLTAAVAPVRPKGPTLALDQTVLTPTTTGTSATLTTAAAVDTLSGEYKITITATGGGKTRRVEVILIVENPREAGDTPLTAGDFTLSTPAPEKTILPGASATYTIVATASGDFSQLVALSAAALPTGVTITFKPSSLTPTSEGASSELTVQTDNATPPGAYEITVTATGGGKTQNTSFRLTIANDEA